MRSHMRRNSSSSTWRLTWRHGSSRRKRYHDKKRGEDLNLRPPKAWSNVIRKRGEDSNLRPPKAWNSVPGSWTSRTTPISKEELLYIYLNTLPNSYLEGTLVTFTLSVPESYILRFSLAAPLATTLSPIFYTGGQSSSSGFRTTSLSTHNFNFIS